MTPASASPASPASPTPDHSAALSAAQFRANLVRYGELKPCKTAFIDAHTPGSDQKENFTIIGGGVSESPDQHVHIASTPGFNIGAAGQPPKCRNSLHSHCTAEVFFVLKGRWRFFWGREGRDGEVVLEHGDIFNIPTGIFRGFENIGGDYSMIMAILGGDDAGGGVIWAPQVIADADAHGLVLGDNGVLYDTKRGQTLPPGTQKMPLLTDEQLARYPQVSTRQVVPNFVARYWDLQALASGGVPAPVIGPTATLVDRPGFDVDFLGPHSQAAPAPTYSIDEWEVLMPVEGHWRLRVGEHQDWLAPGDTYLVPPAQPRSIAPSMSGGCGLYRVRSNDDAAGPTQGPRGWMA